MKEVILGTDGDSVVYSVPDEVADNFRKYCMEFCSNWIWKSSDAAKYRVADEYGEVCACYCEADFIEYLNTWVFPGQPSVFVKNIGWTQYGRKLPTEYQSYPCFHF